jgi:hypothetical protein
VIRPVTLKMSDSLAWQLSGAINPLSIPVEQPCYLKMQYRSHEELRA